MKRLVPIVSILIILGAAGFFLRRHSPDFQARVDPIIQPVIAILTGQPIPTRPEQLPFPPELPRTGRMAPPGFLYMLDRVSVKNETGVVAVIPGEEVRLMQRQSRGRLRITTGRYDFEVKESQVTRDYDLAQAARHRAGIPPQ